MLFAICSLIFTRKGNKLHFIIPSHLLLILFKSFVSNCKTVINLAKNTDRLSKLNYNLLFKNKISTNCFT